ncbi:3'-5' exoribonuclease YhaM family protein [Paenibacillus yanchengensis]|uniref:3'-5' exoribonuclease YhaM family protein n=1 Tax=Paenibacillus yanchengensis TaxID=2035833 RepID=A0ABW4YFN3_9BACL
MMLIKQFVSGDEFTGFYLLKEVEVKQTSGGAPKEYLDIVLSDSSSYISAKLWDASKLDVETFVPMTVVKVQGLVQTYRERLQVKIIRLRKAEEEDNVSITDFIRSAPISTEQLVTTIEKVISEMEHAEIKAITTYCFNKVKDELYAAPAAKTHHHAYYGGLAYHMVRMLELGKFVCEQRPFLRADLLLAGIVLHDIAKPAEMNSSYGIVSDYSNQGKLLGHIHLAVSWITEAAMKLEIALDAPEVLGLQHLVLSHHNLPEWGSSIQPQLPEAVALHYIDAIDAKLQMVEDTLHTTPETEEWTPFIRGLENKAIYRLPLK